LDIPLFGISSLAAIAKSWSQNRSPIQTAPAPEYLAVEMPAQRGEVFGSVYRLLENDLRCEVGLRMFTPETWQAQLAELAPLADKIQAPAAQGQFVEHVLALADKSWQNGDRPHWSSVLPDYGQNPVQIEPGEHSSHAQLGA
jgi:tRNA A37 threonylcarbamoyladenosine modification protein TsaB